MGKTGDISYFSGAVILAVTTITGFGSSHAQQFGNVSEGRRLAHAECAQCHGVDRKGNSTNPAAPAFDDVANVPGMTSTALMVALRTPHRSMPNFVIKGHEKSAQNSTHHLFGSWAIITHYN